MPRKRRYLDETEVPKEASQFIKDRFTVSGVTYSKIPSYYTKGKIANSKTGKRMTDADFVYVRQGADGKWYQTRMDKDAANINYHLNKQDIVNRSNETIDNQWRQGDGETIRVNQGDARARQQWFSNEDATKFLLTTAGLGALGAGAISAPLATALGLAGGYAGGKAVDKGMQFGTGKTWGEWMSDKTGLPEWFSEYTNPGAIVGGTAAAGLGYSKLASAYTNPNSLLNRNIRTEIYNRKFPFTYDMMDKANYTPFYHAAKATLKGKTIKPKSLAQRTYEMLENAIQKHNENSPLRTPFIGESIADYVARPVRAKYPQTVASKYISDLASISNRAKAFSKYLGLDVNDSEPLFLFDKNKTYSNYIKQPDGTYTVPGISKSGSQFVNDMMPILEGPNKGEYIRPDGTFITRDNVIRNHGGVGGKVVRASDGSVELQMEDVFDLQPLESIKWLPKSIRNIEVSRLIPGAKPFTVKFSTHNSHMTPEEFINAKNKYKTSDIELDTYKNIMKYRGKR